ncbi:MAG: hypothetical protein HZA53_17850 [Planctomycetes bacterium]|nr:hypothetical protein [Planctomycetota bacterium]
MDRVLMRSLARIAYAGVRYRGVPSIEAFVSARIKESISELLEEERERMLAGHDEESSCDPYATIARLLGIDIELGRLACLSFNLLPVPARSACYALIYQQRSIEECQRLEMGNPEELAMYVRSSLKAVSRRIGRSVVLTDSKLNLEAGE